MVQDQTELSEREQELVILLARGLSNKEIAGELSISPNTVKVHLRNIYGKLGVSSRTEAMMIALRQGWIEVEASAAQTKEQDTAPLVVEPAAQTAITPDAAWTPSYVLARWQQLYVVLALLLVALGLWMIWPRQANQAAPFSDRPVAITDEPPPQTSRWQQVAQMPAPRDRLAVVAYKERVYAIAGETSAGTSAAVEIYLPDSDTWIKSQGKPTAAANLSAVAIDDRIYVPGGTLADGRTSDRLEIYDIRSQTWTEGSSLPRGVGAYAIAAYQDQIYLFGGSDGSTYLNGSYRYDPAANTWHTLPPMPTARAFAGAGAIGGRIYVVGGYDGQKELDTCEVFDPQSETWDPNACPEMNAPRAGIGVAVIADTMYVVGGGWNNYLVENEYWIPSQDRWQTFPSPKLQEWRNLGVTADGTILYAIGGWDGGYLSANYAYRAVYLLYLPSAHGQSDSTPETP